MLKRLALLVLLGIVAAGAGGWWFRHRMLTPYRGFSADEVFVEVPSGTSVAGIAARLVNAGVVPDSLSFRLAARLSGAERRLQAGEYRFAGPASPMDVAARLEAGDVYTRPVTFPEGLTVREMGAVFERAGLGSAKDFERAGANATLAATLGLRVRALEGYLFPDTYALVRTTSADDLVKTMVARFERAFDDSLRADAGALGMSPHEAVTLASLVEKETARPEERPLVAAVYHNRLRLKMPLQCDPTVIYALMNAGRWNGNIRKDDLQIDSPYNTYRYPALPPGPIASPGRAALEAAVRPADVPYLYFVSRNDGSHVFATTLAEHNRNVTQWQHRR